jgi:hypothetical protein
MGTQELTPPPGQNVVWDAEGQSVTVEVNVVSPNVINL